jgi:signal transduction histidine kinase
VFSSNVPSLSPKRSVSLSPSAWSTLSMTLASGVPFGAFRCSPPYARAAASGATPGAHCAVLPSAEGLARTLLRLHAGRGLAIHVHVPPEHSVRSERENLDEMLGNLLDNACKWARSEVTITSSAIDAGVLITVDDDGPGLEASMRDAVLQRGVRADEAAPGSGLGLAIVRDLAELYGGSIALTSSRPGGLRARSSFRADATLIAV